MIIKIQKYKTATIQLDLVCNPWLALAKPKDCGQTYQLQSELRPIKGQRNFPIYQT